jgi:hypothetical protein
MQGTCQCGGRLREHEHVVETVAGIAKHGLGCPPPVTVERTRCVACGREETRYYRADGSMVPRSQATPFQASTGYTAG